MTDARPSDEQRDRAAVEQRDRDRRDAAEHMRMIDSLPEDHRYQDEWIAQATTPCERLRREWLIDSKRKGRRADFVLPDAEAKQRLAQLFAAFKEQSEMA